MNKNLILIAICVILVICSTVLAFALYKRPRFEGTKGQNPYIMFDTKTAQACWSGPPNALEDKLGFKYVNPANNAELPFCKDLK
jgi:hypothetical protein